MNNTLGCVPREKQMFRCRRNNKQSFCRSRSLAECRVFTTNYVARRPGGQLLIDEIKHNQMASMLYMDLHHSGTTGCHNYFLLITLVFILKVRCRTQKVVLELKWGKSVHSEIGQFFFKHLILTVFSTVLGVFRPLPKFLPQNTANKFYNKF
jgi:hypothetical protein